MTKNEQWEAVCKEWCKQNGAELIFVNDADFGCRLASGQLTHIYVDELLEMMLADDKRKEK